MCIFSFKYQSDDEASSITSGSGPSGAHSSPRPQSGSGGPGTSSQPLTTHHLPEPPQIDLNPIYVALEENKDAQKSLREYIEHFRVSKSQATTKGTDKDKKYNAKSIVQLCILKITCLCFRFIY